MLTPPKTTTVTVDQLRQRAQPFAKVGLIFVAVFPAFQKAVIFIGEFLPFGFFIGKGFHHADAGKAVFHLCVDIPDPFLVPFQRQMHPFA